MGHDPDEPSNDGYYKYYLKGYSRPSFSFFMTAGNGQHAGFQKPGQNVALDQSTSNTSGSLSVDFSFYSMCSSVHGFNNLLDTEQGQDTETNSDTGTPNRFQGSFRAFHPWIDATKGVPEGCASGYLEYNLSVNFSWSANDKQVQWAGTAAHEFDWLGTSSLNYEHNNDPFKDQN